MKPLKRMSDQFDTLARLLLVLPCVVMTACGTVRVEDTRQTAAVIDAGKGLQGACRSA
ncbi:MAG: hypothetical protein IIB77_02445 [Proteobacteria bacterium]|nr:hypothetical protein [Pseudomonadota bacterium]